MLTTLNWPGRIAGWARCLRIVLEVRMVVVFLQTNVRFAHIGLQQLLEISFSFRVGHLMEELN